MEEMLSFDWASVHVTPNELIALLRKSRSEKLDVLFHFEQNIYHAGVNPENTREPFYFEDTTYPSMFTLISSATVEGGYLLTDLPGKLDILSVNNAAPAECFSA